MSWFRDSGWERFLTEEMMRYYREWEASFSAAADDIFGDHPMSDDTLPPGTTVYPCAGGPAMKVIRHFRDLVTTEGAEKKLWKRADVTTVDPCGERELSPSVDHLKRARAGGMYGASEEEIDKTLKNEGFAPWKSAESTPVADIREMRDRILKATGGVVQPAQYLEPPPNAEPRNPAWTKERFETECAAKYGITLRQLRVTHETLPCDCKGQFGAFPFSGGSIPCPGWRCQRRKVGIEVAEEDRRKALLKDSLTGADRTVAVSITVHYNDPGGDGSGCACGLIWTATAPILYSGSLHEVTCEECLRAMKALLPPTSEGYAANGTLLWERHVISVRGEVEQSDQRALEHLRASRAAHRSPVVNAYLQEIRNAPERTVEHLVACIERLEEGYRGLLEDAARRHNESLRCHPLDSYFEAAAKLREDSLAKEMERLAMGGDDSLRVGATTHPPMSLDEAKASGIPNLWGDLDKLVDAQLTAK